MKLNFTLSERDYLTFQLYEHSKNKFLAKKNKKIYLRSFLIIIAIGVLGFVLNLDELMIFVGIMSIFLLFDMFYRLKKRYYKAYSQNATKLHSGRIDMKIELELNEEFISTKTRFGEAKYYISSINEVSVIQSSILVKLLTQEYIIIKPQNIKENQEVVDFFESINIPVIMDLDWKW